MSRQVYVQLSWLCNNDPNSKYSKHFSRVCLESEVDLAIKRIKKEAYQAGLWTVPSVSMQIDYETYKQRIKRRAQLHEPSYTGAGY